MCNIFRRTRHSDSLRGVLGAYAHPPRRSDDSIDIDLLAKLLSEVRVNTYEFLIGYEGDFEAFQQFLPHAAELNINVWACLMSQGGQEKRTPPYGTDYLAWGSVMAELSCKHPYLNGFSIDDFSHEMGEDKCFNRSYLKELYSRLKRPRTNLAFVPCMYFSKINASHKELYVEYMDGILFYYRHENLPEVIAGQLG